MQLDPHTSIEEEQARVQQVKALIASRMESLQEQLGSIRTDIVTNRSEFWDDVTVNLEDSAESAETFASMKQQAEVLSERERSHRHARAQLHVLDRLKDSPYFGRIDFREVGEQHVEHIYIGVGSLLDDDDDAFLIYDWRAPVSGMYYDYAPGPASYETPVGMIQGEMELKRQYLIRGGTIHSMFDTGITIGDELLQQVLGKQSDAQMKSIVATIQREQNAVIRDTGSRLLIVQGAAGSGKTSAALQRVAYLLYRFRETLSAEQILLFSPNPMFNSYVSTVLPELGEENMQQTTFQEYAEHRIGAEYRLESPFDQLEYALSASGDESYTVRMQAIRYKAGMGFLRLMEAYVVTLKTSGLVFKPIVFREREVVSAEAFRERFYSYDASWSIPSRLRDLTDWLQQQLKSFARHERRSSWVEEELELLDTEAYLEAYERLRRKKQYTDNTFDDFEKEKHALAVMVVNEHFKPLRTAVKRLAFLDLPATYAALFERPQLAAQLISTEEASLPLDWERVCAQTLLRLKQGVLPSEDMTPYLLLKDRLEGSYRNLKVRHVFIDEAQDYSPFQYAYLMQLFPSSRFTVLGDWNQAIHVQAAEGDRFAELIALFGEEQAKRIVFTKSYRSTRPIVEFTRAMVEGGAAIEPFNREGPKPTLLRADDEQQLNAIIAAKLEQLQAEGHGTVAVICKTAAESREVYEALRPKLAIRLIDTETVTFEQGLVIIPSYLAKGVEFDAVLLYNASAERYGRQSERRLFYTVCTRAMHELHLTYTGELSPFVAGVPEDLYTAIRS
ncbi:RNA polymerase recycling motor HelD [Paenibacillus sp. YYML68]|uniref:RNA polymerase recycling motor HelD n=1 Tax=Paenibacillus sp. YYML68 TaxID=2909250 RepID=UPI00249115AC|nr:RNA polymerase recycling motor HelD [Paenibacillus sp. YYML68]